MVCGEECDAGVALGEFYRFCDCQFLAFGILLDDAYFVDIADVVGCASVEDWKLGTVHFHEAVVDAEGVEGGEAVLYGGNYAVAFFEHCAALCGGDIVGSGRHCVGAFREVRTAYHIACVGVCRREGQSDCLARMEPDAPEGEAAAECMLIHCLT